MRPVSLMPVIVAPLLVWLWLSQWPPAQSTMSRDSSGTPSKSTFGYLVGSMDNRADVRMILSPTVFAIPDNADLRPAPRFDLLEKFRSNEELDALPLSEDVAHAKPPPFGATKRKLDEWLRSLRLDDFPLASYDRSTAQPDTLVMVSPWNIYWHDKPLERLTGIDAKLLPSVTGDAPWHAVFFVCANEAGTVERMIIETPAPEAAANEQLGRFVRGLRFYGIKEPFCRRLVIRHAPVNADGGG